MVGSLTELTGQEDDFELVEKLADLSKVTLPKAVSDLFGAPVLHETVVACADMQSAVETYLGFDKDTKDD